MDDERRERYAVAMAAAHDGGPEWAYEWYPEADAVMAVADAELDAAHRQVDARRIELLRVNEQRHAQEINRLNDYAADLRSENSRLRAELRNNWYSDEDIRHALEDA